MTIKEFDAASNTWKLVSITKVTAYGRMGAEMTQAKFPVMLDEERAKYVTREIKYEQEIESLRKQLAAEIMRLEIALRIKTEEHKCCSDDLMKLRESEQSGWKEAAIAWEVCGSIHEAFAKKKDALYSTRHSDFERHAEDARRMLSTESKEKVE